MPSHSIDSTEYDSMNDELSRWGQGKYNCGGGIGRRKYKSMRLSQLTVGGHARIETSCRKSGYESTYSNHGEKDRM